MPQTPQSYTTVCVTVAGSSSATNITVLFNGEHVSSFKTRPAPGGALYVCARIPAGTKGVLVVDASGVNDVVRI